MHQASLSQSSHHGWCSCGSSINQQGCCSSEVQCCPSGQRCEHKSRHMCVHWCRNRGLFKSNGPSGVRTPLMPERRGDGSVCLPCHANRCKSTVACHVSRHPSLCHAMQTDITMPVPQICSQDIQETKCWCVSGSGICSMSGAVPRPYPRHSGSC